MKASRTTGLGLIVLGLAAYVFWVERYRLSSEERRALRNRVFQVDTDRVDRLRVRTSAYETGLYISNGVWRVERPRGARAHEPTVRRLLSRLRGFQRGGLITVEDMRQQGHTLADFGLEVPKLALEVGTPSGRREFRVGDPNPLGNKVYVKEEASQNVMLASIDLLDILPDSPDAFYDPTLFPVAADRVEALSLVQEEQTIRLERDGSGWKITEPRAMEADSAKVEALLTKFLRAKAEGFVHSPDQEDEALGDSLDVIRVWPTGGRVAHEVALGNDAPGMPDAAFARLEGREGLLLVSRGVKVLARTPLDTLRNPNLLPSDPEWRVGVVEIQTSEHDLRLERTPDGWMLTRPVERDALDGRVEELIKVWRAGRIVAFQADGAETEDAHGVRFQGEGRDTWHHFQLLRGERLPGRSLLRRDGDAPARVMPDLLRATPAGPEAWLSTAILDFDPERVVRLNVERDDARREFSRTSPEEDWTLADPDAEPVAEAVNRLVRAAGSLRAEEVVALEPDSLHPYGLREPEMRLSFGLGGEAPENRTLLVGPLDDRGTAHVQIMGDSVVYRLSAADTHSLRATLHRMLAAEPVESDEPDADEQDRERETP